MCNCRFVSVQEAWDEVVRDSIDRYIKNKNKTCVLLSAIGNTPLLLLLFSVRKEKNKTDVCLSAHLDDDDDAPGHPSNLKTRKRRRRSCFIMNNRDSCITCDNHHLEPHCV